MPKAENREYHKTRATQELDRAYDAANMAAAEAHLRLSALHLRRLDDLRREELRESGIGSAAVLAASIYASRSG